MSRLTRVKTMIKCWENDVTVLVDTRIRRNKAGLLNTEGNKIFSTDKPFRGIAIKANKRLDPEIIDVDEKNANYVTIVINVGGKKIGIIGIYAPNNDDAGFFREEIANQMAKLVTKTDEQIITGDFNVNLSKGIGYTKRKSYKSEALRSLIKTWDLKDPVEMKASKNKKYPVTYIHTTGNESDSKERYPLKAARLDGVLTAIEDVKYEVKIGRFYPSDHAPVRMELKIMKETGKKVWKLNAKLLENERVVDKWKKIARRLTDANETLEEKLENEINITTFRRREVLGKDAQKRWASLIKIVKADSIEEGKRAAEEKKLKEGNLLSRVEMMNLEKDELDELFDDLNREETEKKRIKSELKNFKLNNSNKRLVKHKAKMEEQSRRINKIQIGDEITTDPDKIKEKVQRYFKYQFRCECKNKKNPRPCKICKTGPVEYAKMMAKNFKKQTHKQKRISYSLKTKLEQDPTRHELDEFVTKKLKAKLKSPGPDGIPYEFVTVMWKEIRSLVFRMIEWFFVNKTMPRNVPEGLIVFLPKKGKYKTIIKNLRPLTLLNSIYKIASGMIAERIKKVLPSIISQNQYGFTEGKQAADLIEISRQMLDDATEKKKSLAIFAIDFSGAFDNISYKAIINALYRRGFGKKIITSIATLLTGNSSKIVVNGRYKGAINIEKSCRQGDPISPYLFILVLDQLLDKLNRARSLKGYELKMHEKTIKMTAAAFADDCYAFLTGREESIKKTI